MDSVSIVFTARRARAKTRVGPNQRLDADWRLNAPSPYVAGEHRQHLWGAV